MAEFAGLPTGAGRRFAIAASRFNYEITEKLLEIAYRHAKGRLIGTLEGGYDLPALGASTAAHVRVLMSA